MNSKSSCSNSSNSKSDEITQMSSASELSTEVIKETNKSADNPDITAVNTKPNSSKPLTKTNSTGRLKPYINIESKYKQSTQEWVRGRTEDNNQNKNQKTKQPNAARDRSRDMSAGAHSSGQPESEPKVTGKKTSTPLTTNKTLDISGISVINKVVETNVSKPDVKLKKALITRRKTIAPKFLDFDPLVAQSSRSTPMTAGLDVSTKDEEFAKSINRSIALQTMYLNLKAKEVRVERKENAFDQISQIWSKTNEIRSQLLETQNRVNWLKNTIDSLEVLENQKSSLKQYSMITSDMEVLFNSLSDLIEKQKSYLKLENCGQTDFESLSQLVECVSESSKFQSFEKLSIATTNVKNLAQINSEIKRLKSDFKTCYESFNKYVNEIEKYNRIRDSNNAKSLSLKDFFQPKNN